MIEANNDLIEDVKNQEKKLINIQDLHGGDEDYNLKINFNIICI